MADLTQEQVIEYLSNMPVIEIAALVKELESKWGVSAAAVVTQGGGGTAPTSAAEEQTEFDVIIESVPAEAKMNAIKTVRALTSLGLKEAKEKVDAVATGPQVLLPGAAKDVAEAAKAQLEAAGAKVTLK